MRSDFLPVCRVWLLGLVLGACAAPTPEDEAAEARTESLAIAPSIAVTSGVGVVVRPRPFPTAPTPLYTPRVRIDSVRAGYGTNTVVGVVPGDKVCPVPGARSGWTGGEMFPGVPVLSEFGRKLCSYTTTTGASINNLPGYCPNAAGCTTTVSAVNWLEQDNVALMRQASTEALTVIAGQIRSQFKAQLRVPGAMPAGMESLFPLSMLPTQTRLAILDDSGDHGAAVEQVARASACSASVCPIDIRRVDVFAQATTASVVKLAQEIVKVTQQAKADGARLVINLSLGFHPDFIFEVGQDQYCELGVMHLAFEALRAALNYAGCMDAIVVSAAGNRDGGDESVARCESQLLPAGWGSEGLQGYRCDATHTNQYKPLAIAAGAVRPDGKDAPSTRPDGQAAYVAPGYATTLDAAGKGTLFWEGSSFSSAAMAAVTAATWAYMPSFKGLTSEYDVDVMRVVSENAKALAGRTTKTGSPIVHVRMCHAIKGALAATCNTGRTLACTLNQNLSCTEPSATPWPHLPAGADATTLNASVSSPAAVSWSSVAPPAECGSVQVMRSAAFASNDNSCPFSILSNGQDAMSKLNRSPGDHGCPQCFVLRTNPYSFYFNGALLSSVVGKASNPVLRVKTVANAANKVGRSLNGAETETLFELGDALASSSESLVLPLVLPAGTELENAVVTLEYELDQGTTTTAESMPLPLLVTGP